MKVKDLKPNPRNPRTISDEKLQMLKRSMEEYGDLSGIVFNRKTKQLVGAHQRLKLIDPESPITITKTYKKPTSVGTLAEGYVELNGEKYSYRCVEWDSQKEKAANLAANKGAGEWDFAELGNWMKELEDFGFDLNLTMFDEEERKDVFVSEHMRSHPGTGVDEDEIPESAPARTKLGDVYELGEHRLMCGDATSMLSVEKLMNGEKVDMVFTDPPYGVSAVGGSKAFGSVGGSKAFGSVGGPEKHKNKIIKANLYRPIIGDDTTQTAIASFQIAKRFSKTQIMWGAQCYAEALEPSQGWIVWDKDTTGNFGDGELAWTNQNRAIRIFKHTWNGLIKESERREKRCHPTQKPVALAQWCFENYGEEAESVLDLFGGSGSTLIACEKTKRKCFMMEIDPVYCDVIIERFVKYSGKEVIRESDKKTWTEIKSEDGPKRRKPKASDIQDMHSVP